MRIRITGIILTILFIILGFGLFALQILNYKRYVELSFKNHIRLIGSPATRGKVLDRNGVLLATSIPSFRVYLLPQEVLDFEETLSGLSKILNLPYDALKANYKKNYFAPFAPVEIIRDVFKSEAFAVEEARLDLEGVMVRAVPMRHYIFGEAISHLIGYLGEIDREELEELKPYGYRFKDYIGKGGIERALDRSLRGRDGGVQVEVDNRGRHLRVLGEREPIMGREIVLTIDARLQRFLYTLMKEKKGAAIFMNPYTGEVLALLSLPGYDANRLLNPAANSLYIKGLMDSKDSPFLNRAVSGTYPPGSIFKIITAVAVQEIGKPLLDRKFLCKGRMRIGNLDFDCWNLDGHGEEDLRLGLIHSCNIYFYHAGLVLGVDKIVENATLFGFGRKTGVDMLGEAEGFLPTRAWKALEKRESWFDGDTANLAIGQGFLSVTPIQVLRMIAAVSNEGYLVRPFVIKKIGNAESPPASKIKLDISEQTLKALKRAMMEIVDDPEGTGHLASLSDIRICAKTGTAQAGPGRMPHAWFGGFAPLENPEICFVIFLENGGSGGEEPARIAREAVKFWLSKTKME